MGVTPNAPLSRAEKDGPMAKPRKHHSKSRRVKSSKSTPKSTPIVSRSASTVAPRIAGSVGGNLFAAGQSINIGTLIAQPELTSVVEDLKKRLSELEAQVAAQTRERSPADDERLKAAQREIETLRSEAVESGSRLADEYLQQKRWAEAIPVLDRLIKHLPDAAALWSNRGLVRYQAGDRAGAIADFTRAIELDPKLAAAFYNRGIARAEAGDRAGAIADYTRAIALDPQGGADAHWKRVTAARMAGRHDLALESLRFLADSGRDDLDLHMALASVYDHLGEAGKRDAHLQQARERLAGGSPYSVACFRSVAGNAEAALDALAEAAQAPGFDPQWASEDSDLERIRQHPRFAEIVKRPPGAS